MDRLVAHRRYRFDDELGTNIMNFVTGPVFIFRIIVTVMNAGGVVPTSIRSPEHDFLFYQAQANKKWEREGDEGASERAETDGTG